MDTNMVELVQMLSGIGAEAVQQVQARALGYLWVAGVFEVVALVVGVGSLVWGVMTDWDDMTPFPLAVFGLAGVVMAGVGIAQSLGQYLAPLPTLLGR